jgi:hypothetical protein
MQPQLKAGALGALLGPIGAGIAAAQYDGTVATSATLVDRAQFDAMTGDAEWKRALYAPAENPKKVSVIVSYLDLEVDGRRAFVRVVSPLQVDEGRNPFLLATEAAIQEALKQLPDAPATPASAPPAAVAAPIAPATPAPAAIAHDAGGRPANAMHLDRAALDGHTLAYPHPRNPATYGDVRLAFAGDIVTASNNRSSASGHYTLAADQLCMNFDSPAWAPFCLYVLDSDSDDGNALRVLFPRDGQTRPATLR